MSKLTQENSRQPRPGLFHDAEDVVRLRQLLKDEHPHVMGILACAKAEADKAIDDVLLPPDKEGTAKVAGDFLVCSAVAYLLTGEEHYTRNAHQAGVYMMSGWYRANLSLSTDLQKLVTVYECCRDAWSTSQRHQIEDILTRGARTFFRQRYANPHVISNNWWAVTHAGALTCALAVHGQCDADGKAIDLAEVIDWAAGRLACFCQHYGDAGYYHEGIGYQVYASVSLLPALFALKRVTGRDVLAQFPNLKQILSGVYLLACLRECTAEPQPIEEDGKSMEMGWGTTLSWNDSGHRVGGHKINSLGMVIAPVKQRGELRWLYDRFFGYESPHPNYAPKFGGLYHSLVHYPYGHEPEQPGSSLPLHAKDSRQGLWALRNRYQDGDDCVFGAYAKVTHIGGHAQHDAGSIRMMGLGYDWIVSAGQNRADARWQTVLCPAEEEERSGRRKGGLVIWNHVDEQGGQFGMDLRSVSEGYHERYVGVAWPTKDRPFCVALLDLVDNHFEGRSWWWSWAFGANLDCEILNEQQGFVLRAPDRQTTCRVLFHGLIPDQLDVQRMPDSERGFSSGKTVRYPGQPYVRAIFSRSDALKHIYVSATVQRGELPEVTLADPGVALQIGDWRWDRPFGAAVPQAFRLGESRSLCLEPAGFDWPEEPERERYRLN